MRLLVRNGLVASATESLLFRLGSLGSLVFVCQRKIYINRTLELSRSGSEKHFSYFLLRLSKARRFPPIISCYLINRFFARGPKTGKIFRGRVGTRSTKKGLDLLFASQFSAAVPPKSQDSRQTSCRFFPLSGFFLPGDGICCFSFSSRARTVPLGLTAVRPRKKERKREQRPSPPLFSDRNGKSGKKYFREEKKSAMWEMSLAMPQISENRS